MVSYATTGDLTARWRPLTDDAETIRAATLLGDASQMVRDKFTDIDDRIDLGTLSPLTVKAVVCSMVARAMSPRVMGAESSSTSVGQISQQVTYSNPEANLYITKAERARLSVQKGRRAFSISTIPVA